MMRIPAQLKAAALIGLAVVVGLLGVGGSWALWNAAAPSGAGAVQSADFKIQLGGTPMAVSGTTAAAEPENPTALLRPGAPVYATITVANNINATSPVAVTATMGTPKVTAVATAELSTVLTVRTGLAPSTGGCAGANYTAPASAVINQSSSRRFCLQLALSDGATSAAADQSATVTIPVTATQQPRGN